jgi:hypothetical protein
MMRTQHDTCHMYAHDRIEVCGTSKFSIGKFATEYASGPNLRELASFAAQIAGSGSYGLKSCRNAGFYGSSGLS